MATSLFAKSPADIAGDFARAVVREIYGECAAHLDLVAVLLK